MNFWLKFENRVYAWLRGTFSEKTARRTACAVLVLSTLLMLAVSPLVVLLIAIYGAITHAWPAVLDAYYVSLGNFRMAWDAWRKV